MNTGLFRISSFVLCVCILAGCEQPSSSSNPVSQVRRAPKPVVVAPVAEAKTAQVAQVKKEPFVGKVWEITYGSGYDRFSFQEDGKGLRETFFSNQHKQPLNREFSWSKDSSGVLLQDKGKRICLATFTAQTYGSCEFLKPDGSSHRLTIRLKK
jgi:hypothetical protein